MNIRSIGIKISLCAVALMALLMVSCDKTESYTDLLKKEQKAGNWFLAQHRVCNDIPKDSVFEVGPNAPFYRMDDDGYIYMQVLRVGDREYPESGDQVYFTFTRYNVETMYNNNTLSVEGEGNQDDFLQGTSSTYFLLGNTSLGSSASFGSGIQMPVTYLGYNSQVNILLKSYYGFLSESTTCVPYLVNVRYFKGEY